MYWHYLQFWRVLFLILFSKRAPCLCHHHDVRFYAPRWVFWFFISFFEVLPSSILKMVPSINYHNFPVEIFMQDRNHCWVVEEKQKPLKGKWNHWIIYYILLNKLTFGEVRRVKGLECRVWTQFALLRSPSDEYNRKGMNSLILLTIFTNPSARAGYDTTGFNLELSFS